MSAVVIIILFVMLGIFVPISLLPAIVGKEEDLDSVAVFHE
jgi:hypothetical protein